VAKKRTIPARLHEGLAKETRHEEGDAIIDEEEVIALK